MSRIQILLMFLMVFVISACSDADNAGADNTDKPQVQQAVKPKPDYMVIYAHKGEFSEIKEYLVDTITNRGIVINNTSHIGSMLDRTGGDVGASKQVYLHAEAVEFCSAIVSRKMMEADAKNIIFCPYIIAIYVLPQQPDTVYLSYRRPYGPTDAQSQKTLLAVEDLLDSIIKETIH